ncbi:MAG: Nif3-like dinuclear metal center hexameric protein [Propioniciclava sp.]
MVTVSEITDWFETAYPPSLAESWDRVGLAVGDPQAPVSRVLFAVDVTEPVVTEALRLGAEMIIAHHPLLLRGVHTVRADDPKGRLITDLIRGEVAVFNAHTNADSAARGVAEALADLLELSDRRPLVPAPRPPQDKLVTFVPAEHVDAVLSALGAAGAGNLGAYADCAYTTAGEGRFTPQPGADPFIGTIGQPQRTPETRIEVVLPRQRRAAVVAALGAAHPYEEPAFDVVEMAWLPSSDGLGRIGDLPHPIPAAQVASRLAERVPTTAGGIKLGGDPERILSRIAVLGGAGDSLLDAAREAGVDAYITGDLRHHPAQDFLAQAEAPVLIDVPHWAAEWTWLPHAEQVLHECASQAGVTVAASVSQISTDPWRLRFG